MGMGTVFIGLICIVLICNILGAVIKGFSKTSVKPAPTVQSVDMPIPDKQAIVAGTCAVIAEELGTDVSNIRVLSFKRV
jgi:Na+-transporting methylmalonyl-CoA/oxaloacetate decarboxylase gamma subunit